MVRCPSGLNYPLALQLLINQEAVKLQEFLYVSMHLRTQQYTFERPVLNVMSETSSRRVNMVYLYDPSVSIPQNMCDFD